MRDAAFRIRAIVVADFLIRFRRVSTAVMFLILGGSAYLGIPDPASGRALIVIEGRRAIYNSATIGMGTASLATILIGLFGFYFISNAFRRDVQTRCGFVIASTPVKSIEYILGKFLGNVLFLFTFTAGFMMVSMAGLLVRAEAPLEPLVFLWQYALLLPPALVMVAMLAVVFESVSWLSGRFGDVAFFLIWVTGLTVVTVSLTTSTSSILRYFDYSGFAFMVVGMKSALATESFSIGASDFDPSKPVLIFKGLVLTKDWILPRLATVFLPLALLPIAQWGFHRFDPARIRKSQMRASRTHRRFDQSWLQPITRALGRLLGLGRPTGVTLLDAARNDAFVTLSTFPFAPLGVLGFAIASLVSNDPGLRKGVLPVLFACLALLLADVSCREMRAGTQTLVWASPRLRQRFVAWKFLTTVILGVLFVLIPASRLLLSNPTAALGLVIGTLFLCSAATSLGVLSSNPKAFVVLFLSFFYLVVNDGGRTPSLDFAGFHGTATHAVMAAYAALTVVFVAVAVVVHQARTARE
jgi:hypothetical protein